MHLNQQQHFVYPQKPLLRTENTHKKSESDLKKQSLN